MTHAVYGRMQLGRCVQHDMGYLGCQTDVLGLLDEKCSNKRSCEFTVFNELNFDPNIANPCKELSRYLEADYSCHKSKRSCRVALMSLASTRFTSRPSIQR